MGAIMIIAHLHILIHFVGGFVKDIDSNKYIGAIDKALLIIAYLHVMQAI